MMYPFMTLNDDTEITHSEMKADGKVKVYIETPDEFGGFHNATCWLPDYRWEILRDILIQRWHILNQLIRNNAHLIIEFSQEGGILNARRMIEANSSDIIDEWLNRFGEIRYFFIVKDSEIKR